MRNLTIDHVFLLKTEALRLRKALTLWKTLRSQFISVNGWLIIPVIYVHDISTCFEWVLNGYPSSILAVQHLHHSLVKVWGYSAWSHDTMPWRNAGVASQGPLPFYRRMLTVPKDGWVCLILFDHQFSNANLRSRVEYCEANQLPVVHISGVLCAWTFNPWPGCLLRRASPFRSEILSRSFVDD